jgi:phage terminase large subunit GpA-like protein
MSIATPAGQLLRRMLRTTLGPRERLTVDQWADRNRRLTAEAAAEPGPWSTDRAPYLRGPMRAMTRADVDEISLGFASQTGKTELLINFVGWMTDQDPAPTMWFWPNEDLAGEFSRDRFVPSLEQSPRWLERLGSSPRDKGALHIKFRVAGCDLWFKGAGSDAQGKSKPAKHRLADEIDSEAFDPAMLHHARQRGAAWPGGKFIKSSIPSLEGVGIDGELQRSVCHWYHVPCPHCGEYQRLVFANLKWEGGGRRQNADRAEATAHYACDRCGAAIYEHHKPWMLRRGVWLAGEGARVEKLDADAELDELIRAEREGHVAGLDLLPGYRVVGEPTVKGRHWGYRLSALYSPWVTFGAIAKGWCEHDGEPPREWFNGVLAEAWSPRGDRIDSEQVVRLCLSVDRRAPEAERRTRGLGAYLLGEIPPGALVLTGGIDLQRDRAYATVRAWGEHCRESWLVWFGVVKAPHGDENATAEALHRLVSRVHGVTPATRVGVSRWAIDSGDGVRTAEVYRFARQYPGRVFACKGRTGATMNLPSAKTLLDKYPDGTTIPGGLVLLTVNSWTWKSTILGKLKQPAPGATREAAVRAELEAAAGDEVGGRWWWPDPDTDASGAAIRGELVEYLEQLTSEHLVIENARAVERGARPTYAWKLRPGRKANHFLDAEVYAAAIADAEFAWITRAWVDRYKAGAGNAAQGANAAKANEERRKAGGGALEELRDDWRERYG